MATTLQQQLAAIAANSTHQLDLKAQKARHSKSLLFEPRDAATQSFDTIYQLCFEGFEELCHLDSRFAPFARNLFSEQSKDEDRTQMNAKENQELDGVIERFLGLLGGRLLLKPAMKAAEWLVRRFRAHEYNTQVLLLTFLPYHSSHIFPTLLSILPDQLPPIFRFLHPYVSSLQSPPRHAIVAAATNNAALLTAFSQYVMNVAKARHHSAVLLRYWASITAQAVSGMADASRSGRETIRRQKEEDLLLKVLPILQNGLAITGNSELYLGLCMIIVILATKASLSEKVLNALMEAVAGGWNEDTIQEGITCLALLAEEKEEASVPRSVLRAILKENDFPSIIDRVGGTIRVEKLLAGASARAIERNEGPKASQLVISTISSQDLTENAKIGILEKAIESVKSSRDDSGHRKEMQTILSTCAGQDDLARLITAAANRCQASIASLDADLALQLVPEETQDETEPDPMMLDIDEGAQAGSSLDLDSLPKLPNKQASFLDHANEQLFVEYCSAFHKALHSEQDLSALLNSPALEKATCFERPSLLSFLARVWSSDAPNSARLKALQITTEVLEEGREEKQTIDMQALIPYIIVALADSVRSIRSAAAAACLAISRLYTSKADKDKVSDDISIWCKDSVYGKQSANIYWLSSTDAKKFISEALMPVLEDCLVDSTFIVQTLIDAINASSSTSRSERKDMKSALRASSYALLASHVIASPVHNVKLRLLAILSKIGKIAGSARVQILLPYVQSFLVDTKGDEEASQYTALSRSLLGSLTFRSADELQCLKSLAADSQIAGAARSKLAFDRLRQLWSSMKDSSQTDLIDWLLTLGLDADTSEDAQSHAVETLKSLSLPTDILVHLVDSLPSVSELQGYHTPAKKQRTGRLSETPKPGSVDKQKLSAAVRRITMVLELVEESKPEKHPQLLKGLFHFLSELHHYKIVLDSELVYLQGLLINSLLSVVTGLQATSNKEIDPSVVRTDLIVDCVRNTSSTQVHQAALLLMSALGAWAPARVLHSVMPLFTFMSSTILKQGDDYSAHVTDQTVARIIPPLAASLKKDGKDLISGAAELLASFTAAYEHIPLHRRLGLFKHLVETLGAQESLFAIVAMLIERYPGDAGVRPFVASLMREFPVAIQMHAFRQYLDLIFDTLKPKRTLSNVILGYVEKNAEQATEATSSLLDGFASIVSQDALRKKLAKLLKKNDGEAEQLRVTYSVVLEKTMQLELQLQENDELGDAAGDLLSALLGLMPTKDFIESSAKLMQTGSNEIRQQVFASLEQRVNTAKQGDASLQQIFVEVLPNCAVFVTKSQPVATRTAAVACIDRICEKFGKTDRVAVMQAAEKVVGDAALGSEDTDLRRISLLCLAGMIDVLGDEFIPMLPKTLDLAIQYLQDTLQEDDDQDTLIAACFTVFTAVLDHVSRILSGTYLDRILFLSAEAEDFDEARQFVTLAAKRLSPQETLAAIDRTWDQVFASGVEALQLIMTTVDQTVQHHPKAAISKNAQTLFSVLSKAFDLRPRLGSVNDEEGDLTELLDLVNSTTMNAVLKLNDATFRPFFLRLGDWAFSNSNTGAEMVYKCTSFFSFALVLFEQLKSLVTSYVGFMLENTASLLGSLSPSKEDERNLLDLVVRTLASNFSHDQDGYWQTPSHFDAIVSPLLSLLTKASNLPAGEHVIPAITEFATVANAPEHHKTINSIIMSYMRHEDAAVRLAAVKCERSLTERLDIEWCNFIPEWVPFISELQEDDDGVVERETLRWMQQIQDVTGEDINDMMR